MDFDKFLGGMQKLIAASQQADLFGNKEMFTEKSVTICVEFLKGLGYSIRPPMAYPFKINKLDELIAMFYMLEKDIYDAHLLPYSNVKRDRAIAKSFVERRMKDDGISKSTAMQQCALIIRTVFRHPEIFKFETPPTFGVFGQGDMGWVTERAIQIINKDIAKEAVTAAERAANKMTEKIEEVYVDIGFSAEQLDAFRKRLEEQHGKKESRS
ncbi:MAG: hypothetical protein DRN81_06315 [Thermoproteota archaeon]|nr:MAG: hypothetical protein DRN81_06315 [Candidatus Korarchaeota archaeon]